MSFEWFVSGNLGNDPRMFSTNSGKDGANITVGVNVPIEKEDTKETVWIDAVLWGWMAEKAQDLKKGDGVWLRGRVKRKFYEYKGEQRAVWSMNVNEIITKDNFFSQHAQGGDTDHDQAQHQQAKSNGYQPQKAQTLAEKEGAAQSQGNQAEIDDDIPF
jgi:single-strand DNA-binding protein